MPDTPAPTPHPLAASPDLAAAPPGVPAAAPGAPTAPPDIPAVHRLYGGFAARDPQAILAALHPEFVGHVSAGMPLGVGGRHDGPQTMLLEVWGPIAAAYDVAPVPDELLPVGPDRVVATGGYRGSARATGAPMDAAFAHVLRLRDGLVCELTQITDTASWPAPTGS